MKFFFLLFFSLLASASASAGEIRSLKKSEIGTWLTGRKGPPVVEARGGSVGNGGFVLKCDNPNEPGYQLVDTHKYRRRLKYELPAGSDEFAIARGLIGRLAAFDEFRSKVYLTELERFESVLAPAAKGERVDGEKGEVELFEDEEFHQPTNFSHVGKPEGCAYVLVINQLAPAFELDRRFRLDLDVWKDLPPGVRAGLLVHEIVLKETLLAGATTTDDAMYFTALLHSADFTKRPANAYAQILSEVGLLYYNEHYVFSKVEFRQPGKVSKGRVRALRRHGARSHLPYVMVGARALPVSTLEFDAEDRPRVAYLLKARASTDGDGAVVIERDDETVRIDRDQLEVDIFPHLSPASGQIAVDIGGYTQHLSTAHPIRISSDGKLAWGEFLATPTKNGRRGAILWRVGQVERAFKVGTLRLDDEGRPRFGFLMPDQPVKSYQFTPALKAKPTVLKELGAEITLNEKGEAQVYGIGEIELPLPPLFALRREHEYRLEDILVK